MECIVCYERIENSIPKLPSYCLNCINRCKSTLWFNYIKDLRNSDCIANLKRLLLQNVPQRIKPNLNNIGEEIIDLLVDNIPYSTNLDMSLTLEQNSLLRIKLNEIQNSINELSDFEIIRIDINNLLESFNL